MTFVSETRLRFTFFPVRQGAVNIEAHNNSGGSNPLVFTVT